MKVLFLDIDGVLNNRQTLIQQKHEKYPIDSSKIKLVNEIIDKTKCKIVLSSSWRHDNEAIKFLENKGIKVHDITSTHKLVGSKTRGYEVFDYLNDNLGRVENFAILDDDSDFLPYQKRHLFKTEFEEGLTKKIATKVIKFLGVTDD